MFTQHFKYRKINHQHFTIPYPLIAHNYSFVGNTGKRYIVIAEQYEFHVFAVKFYLQEDKSCKHKFQKLTKLFECSRVITTVGKIVMDLTSENPYSSFVFIGSNSAKEAKPNNKRFRLYARIIENLVSPLIYEHHYSVDLSSYVMLNRHNEEPMLLSKIENRIREVIDYD